MFGKILGCYFGYTLCAPFGGGFIGLIVGWWIGAQFDRSVRQNTQGNHFYFQYTHSRVQQVFFQVTFAVMGCIAKSDGVVTRREIDVAEHFMRQMQLNPITRRAAIAAFNQGKQANFDLVQALHRLQEACHDQPILMRLFVDIQYQAASVDGITREKQVILDKIAQVFGLSSRQYQHGGAYTFNQQARQQSRHAVAEAYDVLGVQSDISDADLKKAYRKLLGKHHPDRLIAQGLPKEMIKVANDKTASIKKAYETIMASRESR